MKTILYIDNDLITVKNGKKIEYIELKDGIYINGVILDFDYFVSILKINRRIIKHPKIIFNTNKVVIKRFPIPYLKRNQVKEIFKSEIKDVDNNKEYLIDFITFKGHKDTMAVGIGVEIEVIENLVAAFSKAKIKISSINTLVDSTINYVNNNKSIFSDTFVINYLLTGAMVSVLFHGNEFIISNQFRMFSTVDSDSITEIGSKLAIVNQFNETLKEKSISNSYYFNFKKGIIINLETTFKNNNLKVKNLCDISYKNNKIDFKKVYQTNRDKNNKLVKYSDAILITLLIIAICLFGCANFYNYYNGLMEEKNSLNSFVNDPENVEKYEMIDKVNSDYKMYVNENLLLEKNLEILNDEISVELVKYFYSSGLDINTKEFSYDDSIKSIWIELSAGNEKVIDKYLVYLKQNEDIRSIDYTGFEEDDGRYNFGITVIVKGDIINVEETE